MRENKKESLTVEEQKVSIDCIGKCNNEYLMVNRPVESDNGNLVEAWPIVRDGIFQPPGPLAEHCSHDLHQLRGILLTPPLHHTNLSPTPTLPVPDVLSQENSLEREREQRRWGGGGEEE